MRERVGYFYTLVISLLIKVSLQWNGHMLISHHLDPGSIFGLNSEKSSQRSALIKNAEPNISSATRVLSVVSQVLSSSIEDLSRLIQLISLPDLSVITVSFQIQSASCFPTLILLASHNFLNSFISQIVLLLFLKT